MTTVRLRSRTVVPTSTALRALDCEAVVIIAAVSHDVVSATTIGSTNRTTAGSASHASFWLLALPTTRTECSNIEIYY